jgi:hypothetical protein
MRKKPFGHEIKLRSTSSGTYWTRIQGGIPVSDFVNKSGDKVSTEGIVRLVSDDGAYLERYKKGGNQLESIDWAYWQPNKTPRIIAK